MAAPSEREGTDRIDERYVDEWIEFGLAELIAFLTKHANFDKWCREHHREETA